MVSLHWASSLLVGLSLSTSAAAQFVTASTGFTNVTGHAGVPVRYKQVPPGICELNPNVRSFSGYADIAADRHAFFWFFEAREVDPATAPLTVWVSGGPGSSSMNGLWKEIGPCRVDAFGNVQNNPHAWSRRSNLLFVDQPTHVGFSYSVPVPAVLRAADKAVVVLPNATCPASANGICGTFSLPHFNLTVNSSATAAPAMWRTMQGFMGAFPQYSRRGVHLVSQSYGGHYAPVFADYFVKQNDRNIPDAAHIDLKSVLIGNGVYDPVTEYAALYSFAVAPGNTYDLSPFNASTEKLLRDNLYGPGNCLDQLRECEKHGVDEQCANTERYCTANTEDFLAAIAGRNMYDIRQRLPDPFPPRFYGAYLNRADVQAAIGAFTNFTPLSTAVFDAFQSTGDGARSLGVVDALRDLVRRGVSVALWAGDADFSCNWIGNEETAGTVRAPGWAEAGYADLATSDGQVNAHVKQAGRFSFTRFFWAGHEAPFYQPLASLEYFERVISGRDVATGRVDVAAQCAYRSVGPQESTFREGNSTVQWTVVPGNLTYDTNTHKPGAPWTKKSDACQAH